MRYVNDRSGSREHDDATDRVTFGCGVGDVLTKRPCEEPVEEDERLSDIVRVLIADDHPLVLGALRQAVSGALPGALHL